MSSTCPQLGFELCVDLRPELGPAMRARLWEEFLSVARALGLSCAGRSDGQWRQVVWREGSQTEDADRVELLRWAEERDETVRVRAGELFDLEE